MSGRGSQVTRRLLFGGMALLVLASGYAVGRFWPTAVQAPLPEAAVEQSPASAGPGSRVAAGPGSSTDQSFPQQVELADLVGMADRIARGQEPSLRDYAVLHRQMDAGQLANWVRELRERLPPARSEQIIRMLLEKLAEQDPAQAWDLAFSLPNTQGLRQICKQWAAKNPRELLRHYQSLEPAMRTGNTHHVFSALARHEPELVWQELRGDISSGLERSLLKQALKTIARENLARAEMLVDGVKSRRLRNKLQQAIAEGFAEDDLRAALEYCQTIENPTSRREAQLRVLMMAEKDPATAARRLEELNLTASADTYHIHGIMEAWLAKDADAALRWSESLPPEQQQASQHAWVSRVVKADWREGLPLLLADHEIGGRARSQALIARVWSRLPEAEQQEMLGYLHTHDSRKQADQYLLPILRSWALTDAPKALAYARELAGERQDEGQHFLLAVLQAWSNGEPTAAIRHVELLPQDKQGQVLKNSLRSWARNDPQAAARWLQAYEPGPPKDDALEAFASAIQHFDPTASVEWAGEIQDAERRKNAQRYLFRDWHRGWPTQAEAWLENSDVPAAWKREFLETKN